MALARGDAAINSSMDVGDRLRALGVRPLAAPTPLPPLAERIAPPPGPASRKPQAAIENHLPGTWRETAHGRCFVSEYRYPLDHAHGTVALKTLLDLPAAILNHLGRCADFDGVDTRQL